MAERDYDNVGSMLYWAWFARAAWCTGGRVSKQSHPLDRPRFAQDDLAAGQAAPDRRRAAGSHGSVFHAQQAAEKALKASLVQAGIEFRDTDYLAVLVALQPELVLVAGQQPDPQRLQHGQRTCAIRPTFRTSRPARHSQSSPSPTRSWRPRPLPRGKSGPGLERRHCLHRQEGKRRLSTHARSDLTPLPVMIGEATDQITLPSSARHGHSDRRRPQPPRVPAYGVDLGVYFAAFLLLDHLARLRPFDRRRHAIPRPRRACRNG